MPPPTILAHKTGFLTEQTLLLSQLPQPSETWYAHNATADNPVTERALGDALDGVKHSLQQHTRRVYATQATRHVAEQIESLFLHAGDQAALIDEEDNQNQDDEEESVELRMGVDLTNEKTISSLPPSWSLHRPRQAESHPLESKRYEDLAESLASLSTRRAAVRRRVERLRRMETMLGPFSGRNEEEEEGDREGEGEGDAIQQNLVTRGGQVEKELERMRLLLVRVTNSVARLPEPGGSSRRGEDGDTEMGEASALVEDWDVVEKRKVDSLMDKF